MKKFNSFFLAMSFFALTAAAFEGDERFRVGSDDFVAPVLMETAELQGEEEALRKYRCPRGYDRVPAYRWNYRRHRWEFAGYTCRKSRQNGPDRPGRGERRGPY